MKRKLVIAILLLGSAIFAFPSLLQRVPEAVSLGLYANAIILVIPFILFLINIYIVMKKRSNADTQKIAIITGIEIIYVITTVLLFI